MPIRTIDNKRYSARFVIIGAIFCGISLWALYDGFIGYPQAQARAVAYRELLEKNRERDWDALAAENGWSLKIPPDPKESEEYETSIKMQFAMAGLFALIGLPVLFNALSSYGKWIEATDAGITSSWGEGFNYDQILQVDKKKWDKKGIAKVSYQDGDSVRKFVIDDFKFQRPTMDRILYELEQRIDPDKIINGQPEPMPQDPQEEALYAEEQPSNQPA